MRGEGRFVKIIETYYGVVSVRLILLVVLDTALVNLFNARIGI